MDLSDVRRHHLSVILRMLVAGEPRSRAALAAETGLTKGTVSALVADLLERDLVEELETPKGGRVGRPATDVAATGRTVGGLGIEIGVDHIAAAVVDLTGEVRAHARHDADNRTTRPARVIERVRKVTTAVLADADDLGIRCLGGTVAVPGLVDPVTGTLYVAPNLHWFDTDLTTMVSRLDLPEALTLSFDNEANLGALAELRAGAGQGLRSFVYVSGGRGIGAGIVLDGRLVRGGHGFAGELGHVIVDPGGKLCTCGARGCLETIAGRRAEADDDTVADALAVALRNVVHLLDPEAIVLGGTLAARGEAFASDVRDRLAATTLGARWSPCDVRPSLLGADAALNGAATVALDRVLADPTLVPITSAATLTA
ncbi:ROK family transcriptional regulator [soil metagenome]